MKKAIVLIALILAVIVAGCVGKQAQQPPAAPTGDASQIESGATDVGSGISDLDTTSSELDTNINDSDLDLGL